MTSKLSRRQILRYMTMAAGGFALSPLARGIRVFAQDDAPLAASAADVALTPEEIEQISGMGLKLGFETNHRTDDFINLLIKGGEDTAAAYGIEIIVSEANFDAAKQLADMEALIQQEVDGIFLVAVDSDSISSAIIQANEAGIPIVIIGGAPTRGEVLSVMNSTSYDGCYESTRYLIDTVGGGGKIGVVSIPLALPTIRDRELGTLAAIRESRMQLVGLQPVFAQDAALAAAENMIQANPDINAIFANWSLAINGALAAVDASGLDIKVSGYDAEVAGFQRFEDQANGDAAPILLSLAGQQPLVQGKAGIDALCKAILGQDVAADILVPTLLVTHENYRDQWDALYPGIEAPWA
ncbi:MAG: sugar ABC transporter substrate-binding protein [Chloroflexota bacterium]|nr:sugar ABC transporter substrate-binding protein [Chloroflexota bacterium]